MHYLNRHQSSIPGDLWERIDAAAAGAATDRLTARRFLDLEGPHGVGLTSVEVGADHYCREPAEGEAGAVASQAISVPMIRKECGLSARRLEAHLSMGQPLDLSPVEDAAEAVAAREEEFIYQGEPRFGLEGLMTAADRHTAKVGDWSKVEQALKDVLGAVEKLETTGFRGPYALAVSPKLYNNLFRRYDGTDMLQLEHLKRLCELGVFKAPVEGAVVVDPHVGRIVLGQDVMVGYSGNDGIHYQLYVSESAVLKLEEPRAICTLTAT